jgi:hypothetical protein
MLSLLLSQSVPAAATEIAPAPAPDLRAAPPSLSRITGVVELYTSQGCSSCPPADALLKAYAERKDVLALTLPVDYWDYLGWKDTLGSAKHSERQRNYARARGDGQVYTPQVVINGVAHAIGSSKSAIDTGLMLTESDVRASRVPIMFWTDRSSIYIEAGSANPTTMPVALLLTRDISASDWLPLGLKDAAPNVKLFAPFQTNGGFSTRYSFGYWLGVNYVIAVGDTYDVTGTTRRGR